mgnify:CR=1 FL=1
MIRNVVLSSIMMAGTLFGQAEGPVRVDAPISKIFIPNGFDDNDNTEVVIHGKLPSTCYHMGDSKASVDEENQMINLDADVLFYQNSFCIQSITPYIQEVNTGLLKKGTYTVSYNNDPSVEEKLEVKERTTESPDDFLYAPVKNAFIDVNFDSGKQVLKLQGTFPHMFIGCMVLKDVRVNSNPSDVLVVQPIAEIVDGPICDEQAADRSFKFTKGLKKPFYGEGLLHVRTLEGKSLNRYLDIPAF